MSIIVSVKNFGPISEGKVEVTPFTVFVGPNNSGKSFFSTLIYCALANYPRSSPYATLGTPLGYDERNADLIDEFAAEIAREIRSGSGWHAKTLKVSPRQREILKRVISRYLTAYAESVIADLERCLGGQLHDFVRFANTKQSHLEIAIQETSIGWTVRIGSGKDGPNFRVTRTPGIDRMVASILEVVPGSTPIDLARSTRALVSSRRNHDEVDDLGSSIANFLTSSLSYNLFSNFPSERHYLPAARSGIMQSHKTVAAVLVGSAAWVGTRRMDFPQMPGLVTDFIVQLLTLSGPYHQTRRRRHRSSRQAVDAPRAVAEQLEQGILHGSIILKPQPNGYPEILYKVGGFQAPLGRISSMISELAPVVLYLRYVLQAGDFMIIEEPEAHLHPQSQREFARALAELSKSVNVTLTTHSDYFLTEVNNLIRKATLLGAPSVSSTEREVLRLASERVSAYLFRPDEERGTIVERLGISAAEGIPDEEFGKVAEAVYNEAAELQHRILDSE